MIGVFGGSFDPIHFGHLRPALDILQALGLQEVRFIPLNVAVHRTQPQATGQFRLAMVRAAIDGQEGFVADERELLRQGRSYSYDTLASLREEVGPQVPICLLTGADAFQNFASWHRPEDILSIAHVVVMQRPQAAAPDHPVVRDWSTQRLAEGPNTLRTVSGGHILFQEVTQLGISATTIRGLVAKGLSPRYLVPDRVLEIIEREGLYRR